MTAPAICPDCGRVKNEGFTTDCHITGSHECLRFALRARNTRLAAVDAAVARAKQLGDGRTYRVRFRELMLALEKP